MGGLRRFAIVFALAACVFVSTTASEASCLASGQYCGGQTSTNDRLCCPGMKCGWGNVCMPGCRIGITFYRDGTANPSNPCLTCQSSVNATAWTPRPQGSSCNDQNPCTAQDVCGSSGTCAGTGIPGCCLSSAQCGDGLACTTDTCEIGAGGGGICRHTDVECLPPDACSVSRCSESAGGCESLPKVCPPPDACQTANGCDLQTGCSYTTVQTCNDGSACDPVESGCCPQGENQTCTANPSLACVTGSGGCATFGPGTLIVPMDTDAAGQNFGMLRAYGLVNALLRAGIPVIWSIHPSKTPNGVDFTIVGGALEDVRSHGSLGSTRAYRGGPFLVANTDAAAAMPIVVAWQETAGDATTVHRLVSGGFTPPVARRLLHAPRIAILKDGYESIAFNDLNAAGIPDSTGRPWDASSPDLLTESAVKGPSAVTADDGVLFAAAPSGLTRYCLLAAMHYSDVTSDTPGAVQEVRAWLDQGPLTHAFMQCSATTTFENTTGGLFLTTAGLRDDGAPASSSTIRTPSSPLAQLDDAFQVDSGQVDSIAANASPGYKTGVTTLINETGAPLTGRIALLTGRLDGAASNGQVTYLAGHDYSTLLPISTNPQTNGVRLFLNSIFDSGCAVEAAQPDVVLTKSAPPSISSNSPDNTHLTYTIGYSNPGPRPVESLVLVDALPAGTTYVAGSATPPVASSAAGVLRWNLPVLAPGAAAQVTFRVTLAEDGTYENTATLSFSHVTVQTVSSNRVTTVRDTVAPGVTITSGPSGPTNRVLPTFTFTTSGSPVATECTIDLAPYGPCSVSFTPAVPLGEGPHTFYVRVRDAAGNEATASRAFALDLTPPDTFLSAATPSYFGTKRPTFGFTASDPGGGPTTTECAFDAEPFSPCVSPFTVPVDLSEGEHTVFVRAIDAVGNADPTPAAWSFVVDTTNPVVTIPGPPSNPEPVPTSTPTLLFSVSSDGSPVTSSCRIVPVPPAGVVAFASCAPPSFTSPAMLADGSYAFEVQATDAAGNTGSETHAFSVVADGRPVITAPATATTNEDVTLAFTGASLLSVDDPDHSVLSVSLSATHGRLSLATVLGLSFSAGDGTLDPAMTFSGTLTGLNAALATLSFVPTADFNGAASLSFDVTDGVTPVSTGVQMVILAVPDIVDDSLTTQATTPIPFDPIAGTNGASADSFEGTATLSEVAQGAHGATGFVGNTVTYIPAPGWVGADAFTYTVQSGGSTETGIITVNTLPVATGTTDPAPPPTGRVAKPPRFTGRTPN